MFREYSGLRVHLVATIVSSALIAGRAQNLSFVLTLTNDGPRPAVVCAKDAPLAPLYELPRWSAQLAPSDGARPPISVVRLFNPGWGAPSPPHVPGYLKEHGVRVKSGASIEVRIGGCWLPRSALPDDARLRRLLNHPATTPAALPPGVHWEKGDYTRASLLVLGDDCATLIKALASGADDVLFGRALAVIAAPGAHTIVFTYDEREAYGFVPEQPLHVAAPPFKLDVP
jgi:hypothetical protein